ncbi:YgaP family membrane protein [Flavobacterium orientale]|uniref:Inner membrane protein YgaP-like transmembrane domain-containing protein n=1 Tax=Flavobacterium orientale TaxID=1756020 RepID=A0A916Y544_9FLAO|nr:DUF2892 domain-containing protein [Flavobacterium orientale]GGD31181.1 hypothetical protein GCM10011343_21720 [Flavobacterium orientale]
MKKNIGNTDRFVRIIFGIILLILFMSGALIENQTLKWIVLALSVILIVTSFTTFCPLYALLGKSTCEVKKKK